MLFSLQALALDSSPTHRRVLLRGEGSPQARDHTHRTVFRRRAGAVPVPHAPPERGTMGHRSVGHCNRHHPDHVDSPHSPPRPRAALPDLVAAVFRTGALLPEEVARQRRASLGAEAHRLMPHTPDRALALRHFSTSPRSRQSLGRHRAARTDHTTHSAIDPTCPCRVGGLCVEGGDRVDRDRPVPQPNLADAHCRVLVGPACANPDRSRPVQPQRRSVAAVRFAPPRTLLCSLSALPCRSVDKADTLPLRCYSALLSRDDEPIGTFFYSF